MHTKNIGLQASFNTIKDIFLISDEYAAMTKNEKKRIINDISLIEIELTENESEE